MFFLKRLFFNLKGITICYEDYPETHYNLFCQNKSQVSIVTKTTASFVTTNVLNASCLTQPSLILNSSDTLTFNLCNYCFNKNPCSITSQIIDDNGMFNADTYQVAKNYSPTPISVGIFYICVDSSQIEMLNKPNLCSDITLLFKTSTAASTYTSIFTTTSDSSTSVATSTLSSSLNNYDRSTTKPASPVNNFYLDVGVICLKSNYFSIHQNNIIYFNLIFLFLNYLILLKLKF